MNPINSDRVHLIREYFQGQMERVQPVEKIHGRKIDSREKKPEMLSPESIPEPPMPKMEIVKFPNFIKLPPDQMRDVLRNEGIRIQIHPEQFEELPEELKGLIEREGLNPKSKFFLWEDTGRHIDTVV